MSTVEHRGLTTELPSLRVSLSVPEVAVPHRRRLLPALVVLLAVLPALALAADAKAPKVAVLDFRAVVGGAPPDFGVTAARLVAEAFAATGRYQVIEYGLVRDELAKRQLRPPFGVGHLQLVADVLKADLVVHGGVRSLVYDAARRSASITLSLEMVDGPTGNLKKRADGTGNHVDATEPEQRVVLVAALDEAVRKAVESATGVKVEVTTPRVMLPSTQDLPGAAAPTGEELSTTSRPGEALLPPVDMGESLPRTTTPPAELKPGMKLPVAEPRASGIVTEGPRTGGRAGGGATSGGTETAGTPAPPRGTVTIRPEPEEPPSEGVAGEALTPLIHAKVLAKLAPDRVLVTLGSESAVTPKMEMDVYRVSVDREGNVTRRKLGRIRIVKINPTDAEARILEGGPLMATGDYAYYYGE
ncbi:MAG: hypothetical protein FJX75_15160 [Armatimonadetes bacterium]|nr:hypothetical protein [Armatimonadota bacterium]